MSGHGCPVLHELDTREDYGDEMNPPVLSGGDYDISAIRDCAENCKAASLAWSRGDHLRSIALILGLAPGDTAEIDNTVRELIRSRDEWCTEAAKNAGRIEELVGENARLRAAAEKTVDAYCPICVNKGNLSSDKGCGACVIFGLRAALDGKP